ncbi:hypothetical protein AYI68_g3697 [Smittium mucronatum]|uniref:C2H2-type domain-containing protein n=1 Tax=Smittium mucronatum TaxID=133383 RepID=A0A1R0GZB0_9FUNG|nr:hypothetical protein AYI68_g3697 [Smittium mucronatum]
MKNNLSGSTVLSENSNHHLIQENRYSPEKTQIKSKIESENNRENQKKKKIGCKKDPSPLNDDNFRYYTGGIFKKGEDRDINIACTNFDETINKKTTSSLREKNFESDGKASYREITPIENSSGNNPFKLTKYQYKAKNCVPLTGSYEKQKEISAKANLLNLIPTKNNVKAKLFECENSGCKMTFNRKEHYSRHLR